MKKLIPHQYKPFNYSVNDLPLIIYPIKSANDLHSILTNRNAIQQHLNTLYKKHDEVLVRGVFHVVFIWVWRGLLMTDIWIQQRNTLGEDVNEEIGIEKCITFKGIDEYSPVGIASGNTMVTLGREQEHRWKFDSLEEYLDRSKSMPDFPDGFAPVEEF